jgi:DNA-directed RNA polymerase III subunit RPC11
MALLASDGKATVELEITTTSLVDEVPTIVDDVIDCMWQVIKDTLTAFAGRIPKMTLETLAIVKFMSARLVSFLFSNLRELRMLDKQGRTPEVRCALRDMLTSFEQAAMKKVMRQADDDNKFSTVPNCDRICPRCNKKSMRQTSVQTRSADDPATIFTRCIFCETTFKE